MLIFWVTLGILDLLILFFFILLCIISLRHAPNDIRKHEFREGSVLDRLQKEIIKDECFLIPIQSKSYPFKTTVWFFMPIGSPNKIPAGVFFFFTDTDRWQKQISRVLWRVITPQVLN